MILRRPDGLVLGRTGPLWFFPRYRVPEAARAAHMLVVGITGKGKSKLLEACAFQDITAGRGCAVIDPHSDLADALLRALACWRGRGCADPALVKRLIYVNPKRRDRVIPFNVLATPGEPYEIAQNVIEAFRRTWPETLKEAPHFANVMLNALLVLIANRLTLCELPRLLLERGYREQLLNQVTDPLVVSFFHDRYDRWRDPKMRESTLNKVTAFALNPALRLMLGARENRLDFRAMMDGRQVLIVDLGDCDGETRRLLGSLILTGLENAALSRKDLAPEERHSFYAYIDEFQQFAAQEGSAKTLADVLSECRKFGLHLILSTQNLGYLTPRLRWALANVQTKVVFAVSRADAEHLAREIGGSGVDPQAIKHAAQTETQHPLFEPLLNQWEEWTQRLQYQAQRRALVQGQDGRVACLWTQTVRDCGCTDEQVEALRRASLARYGVAARQVARALAGQPGGGQPQEAVAFYEPAGADPG